MTHHSPHREGGEGIREGIGEVNMNRDSKSALRKVNTDIRETLRYAMKAIDLGDWQQAHEFYYEVAALASSAAESAQRNADSIGA